jgi:RNA polymerase sigma-70 factor (ECF subfamily)
LSSDKVVDLATLDDATLVGRAVAGAERAFEILLQRHRNGVLRICMRMLGDRILAEEAAQDIFVKIYYHLREFDTHRQFKIWCSAIAINECRDRLRKRQRGLRTFTALTEAEKEQVSESSDDCEAAREKLQRVEMALDELPVKLKEVVVLKAYGEYSYEEIAKILKVRLGTVMSRLFRARQKLAEIIERGIDT